MQLESWKISFKTRGLFSINRVIGARVREALYMLLVFENTKVAYAISRNLRRSTMDYKASKHKENSDIIFSTEKEEKEDEHI